MNRGLRQYELFRNIPKRGFQIISLLLILLITLSVKFEQEETNKKLSEQNEKINLQNESIKKLTENTLKNNAEIEALKSVLLNEQSKREEFANQLGVIGTTVGTLDKLQKTDEELLQKYSKVYFLNEHYVPIELATIDSEFTANKNTVQKIHADVWPRLKNLLIEARSVGLSLEIVSAYRDFYTQSTLKSKYKTIYGAGTANQFSADQGYSEHQLGTTVDFGTSNSSGTLTGFEKTPEYAWLLQNAHRYGFVLSYPKNNEYYVFEPWHFRFVGRELAERLHNEGKYFYDMDQRVINEYLSKLFD